MLDNTLMVNMSSNFEKWKFYVNSKESTHIHASGGILTLDTLSRERKSLVSTKFSIGLDIKAYYA
jgi:hypothetical protein